MGNDLPNDYTCLLKKFEQMAEQTRELYKDYHNGTVTDSQLQKVAGTCHDTMSHYHRVCETEHQRATVERFPDPIISDGAHTKKNFDLRGLMKMAKRKEGMFQTMFTNADATLAPSLSLRVAQFMNTSSASVGNPVLEWALSNTDVRTDHMEGMLERLEDM